jgi:hypothetical protein
LIKLKTSTLSVGDIGREEMSLKGGMPMMIFMAKFGIEIGFLTSYFASFTDTRIFPVEKRATAIGVCKFMARALCGLAPIVNEFPEPIPISCFAGILFIAFAYNMTLSLPELKSDMP